MVKIDMPFKRKNSVKGNEETKDKTEKNRMTELKEKYEVTTFIPPKKIEIENNLEKKEIKKEDFKREESLPDLVLRVEKLDGKLDLLNNFRITTEEKITDLSEKIGELRSSFLSLEKRFTEIETNSEQVLESVKEVNPISIKKELERRDQENLELRAELEKNKELVEELQRQTKELKNSLNQIGSIENIMRASRSLGDKLLTMEDLKRYVDKVAAKIEVIFSEMGEKLKDVEIQKERIKKLDDLSIEIAKTLDEMSLKVSKSLTEEKLGSAIEEKINEKIKKTEGLETLINELQQKNEQLKENLRNEVTSMTNDFNEKTAQMESAYKQRISKLGLDSFSDSLQRIDQLEENLNRTVSLVDSLSQELENMKNILKEFGDLVIQKIDVVTKTSEGTDANFKFLQTLNLLLSLSDRTSIESTLNELNSIVAEMKKLNVWFEKNNHYTANFLRELSNNWKNAGDYRIARILELEANKYKPNFEYPTEHPSTDQTSVEIEPNS